MSDTFYDILIPHSLEATKISAKIELNYEIVLQIF